MTTPILRLDAAAYEIAALREVLARLVRETPTTFDALFAPGGHRTWSPLEPELAHVLRDFRLIQTRGSDAIGRLPIRRRGDRFYVMALGGVGEYRQDVWPETDALLAILDETSPGSVLDMGTGCGIVAVEAVARGHAVVATDLYENTLALARFNAALNGARGIEWRQGHLFEPVRGETFDLVLTAPHYTRIADQLRLEALRAAAPLSTPTGKVAVATFCEWSGDDVEHAELALTRSIFADHARAGFDVTVTPMIQTVKQNWFTVATNDETIDGLSSRHRFMVEITRAAPGTVGSVHVTMPTEDAIVRMRYSPLAKLGLAEGATARKVVRSPMLAVVTSAPDLAQLEWLIASVRAGLVTLDGELPLGLLDACRFGARTCVPVAPIDITQGAVGAFLDRDGGVRPCAHGGVVATVQTTFAGLVDTLQERATEAAARRGCATCAARDVCSRCLFPHVVDEATYCTTIRSWADALPSLRRLFEVLAALPTARAPLRIKLRRTVPLVAARGRAMAFGLASDALERAVQELARHWSATSTAISVDGAGQRSLFWWDGPRLYARTMHPVVAAVGELVADGATGGELLGYLHSEQFDLAQLPKVFDVFRDLYRPAQV